MQMETLDLLGKHLESRGAVAVESNLWREDKGNGELKLRCNGSWAECHFFKEEGPIFLSCSSSTSVCKALRGPVPHIQKQTNRIR